MPGQIPKIGLQNNNGSLTVRFTYQSQAYRLTGLGKYSDPLAQASARSISEKIKLDLLTGNFPIGDLKLTKYNVHRQKETAKIYWDLKTCWEFYKTCKNAPSSAKITIWRYVDRLLEECDTKLLSLSDAANFVSWCRSKYSSSTLKRFFRTINAAVNLCIRLRKIEEDNPYAVILREIEVRPKKKITAFSKPEIFAIIEAFKEKAPHYAPLIQFRFLTGCRPSEAIALTWDDFKWSENNTKCLIVFSKRYSYGELLEGTKNGVVARNFNCNSQLREFILSLPKIPNRNNLVFPSPSGGYINTKNFSSRFWKPIVSKLQKNGEIEDYLPFYDQRHTFGTHVARSNGDLKTLSSIMGNSPKTLLKNYLAVDNSPDFVPEL
jgi:integrase